MKRILVTGEQVSEPQLLRLQQDGFEIVHVARHLSESELALALKEVDVYLLGGSEIATQAAIAASSRLSHIAFVGVGYGSFIDVHAATTSGVAITNTPGAATASVAELIVGHIINLRRRIAFQNGCAKSGTGVVECAPSLAGSTVGIIGLGEIGMFLARLLRSAFNVKIVYNSRTRKGDADSALDATALSLDELLRQSDIVVPLVPFTVETTDLIGSVQLSLMKQTAILVNVSRAGIVNGHALYVALRDGNISGAAFDGYYVEPLPHPTKDPFGLLALSDDRFIITPHVGAATLDACHEMYAKAAQSILNFHLRGQDRNIVNPSYVDFARNSKRPYSSASTGQTDRSE